MPPRRSEIPSLNLSITRVVRYASGESVYGPDFATVERSTRVRRLETLARDQIIYVGGTDQVNKSLRRYLARPDKEPFTITYDKSGVDEEREISVDWRIGDSFRDSGRRWEVIGVGHYDSQGRMLELLVDARN